MSFEEKQIIEDAYLYACGNVNILNLIKDLQTQTRGAWANNDLQKCVKDCVNAGSTDIWKGLLLGNKHIYI